jgi:hypothetical protein
MKRLKTAIYFSAIAATMAAQSVVQHVDGNSGALSGRNIAIWQSHGRYYKEETDRWQWQRCRLFGTVEDLYTRSYVVPLLVPMLEQAGAYVMLPRERDVNSAELIIDPDGQYATHGYHETHVKEKWENTKAAGFGYSKAELHEGENPFKMGKARKVKSTQNKEKTSGATWSGKIPEAGEYAVYVSYQTDSKSASDVRYTVHTAAGDEEFIVDQTRGGGTWIYLGTFPFAAGESTLVSISNYSEQKGTVVTADAVKIGGGMGNVARRGSAAGSQYHVSGLPRWAEGSRYWLQWAGIPESVYTAQEKPGDYRDDIFCRPQWVNYLVKNLNIPVDLAMGFHSDAGTTNSDTETVGTLGICYTKENNGRFSDGRSRQLNYDLTQSIVNSIVRDVRRLHNPTWSQRDIRDKSYIEARVPDVPSMLLELLSHQNFADMQYGLDPQFRFDVCRAVYKGILRFLANQGSAKYIVEPLPVSQFTIHQTGKESFELQWAPTYDELEATAVPTRYRIEERIGSPEQPFVAIAETTDCNFRFTADDRQLHSFRIVALNDGGAAMPSPVLALGVGKDAHAETVTVVDGFTRVSAPESFSAGSMAGFGLNDPGVPSGTDLLYTGRQTNFNRADQWIDDDEPGFGASAANYEMRPIYGNAHDNVVLHGEAILAAGHSFVSSTLDGFCADSLQNPPMVDVVLGLQRSYPANRYSAFSPLLQQRLNTLSMLGSGIIVSGAYVGSDLSTAADKSFAATVLGYAPRTDHACEEGGVSEVASAVSSVFDGGKFSFSTSLGEQPYAVTSPDAIIPATGAKAYTVMRYDENQTSAAVAYEPATHRAVTLGFPLEAIASQRSRYQLMQQMLKYLEK